MDETLVNRLLQLNRDFYERFAEAFSDTRGPQQDGLQRLLAYLPKQGTLLDVGCGNGRLAHVLDQAGLQVDYLGLDASAGLLEAARRQAGALTAVQASFWQVDVLRPGWATVLAGRRFEAVALLAVLHHVPSRAHRVDLLRSLGGLLAPHGVLAISTWQFLNSQRLRRKLVPWQEIGVSPADLEPGDYLVDWRRGGQGLRYCHWVSEQELGELIDAAGLHLRATFYADGREGNLNLFGIAGCPPGTKVRVQQA